MPRNSKEREALEAFNRLLDEGGEWPDAQWLIFKRFGVSAERIAELHDEEGR